MNLVDSGDWLEPGRLPQEQVVRLKLLDSDVQSVQFAFEAYQRERARIEAAAAMPDRDINKAALAAILHHAKVFVCAVRRVGRLGKALSSSRYLFEGSVGEAIRIAWKKKRKFFQQYIGPRNAIEHIDGEVPEKTDWVLVNMEGDVLAVTEKCKAEVTESAVNSVVAFRNEIVRAVMSEAITEV